MQTKRKTGSVPWTDADNAPPLTAVMPRDAEIFEGDRFVSRGPGRPKSAGRKELISFRLDPDVLAKLREAGPGWQSAVNRILRQALELDQK